MKKIIVLCALMAGCSKVEPPPPVVDCTATATAISIQNGVDTYSAIDKGKAIEKVAQKMARGQEINADFIYAKIKLFSCSFSDFDAEKYPGNDFAMTIKEKGESRTFTTSQKGFDALVDGTFQTDKDK